MQTSVKGNHLIVIWISMVTMMMCPTATVHFQKLTEVHERSKFPFSSRRYQQCLTIICGTIATRLPLERKSSREQTLTVGYWMNNTLFVKYMNAKKEALITAIIAAKNGLVIRCGCSVSQLSSTFLLVQSYLSSCMLLCDSSRGCMQQALARHFIFLFTIYV